jgi:hypothetical protein
MHYLPNADASQFVHQGTLHLKEVFADYKCIKKISKTQIFLHFIFDDKWLRISNDRGYGTGS